MSSIYITTSRKPGMPAKKLAKWLAALLHAERENRGKRGMEEIAERAGMHGRKRLLFVYEKHGNPSSLSFWEDEWLEPEVHLKNVEFLKADVKGKIPFEIVVEIDGSEKAGRIKELLDLEEENDSDLKLLISKDRIEFKLKGKKIGPVLNLK